MDFNACDSEYFVNLTIQGSNMDNLDFLIWAV